METLYPLDLTAPGGAGAADTSVTILLNPKVAAGQEEGFLQTLRELEADFNRLPGTMGCKVFRQTEGEEVEFSVALRFAHESDHEAWLKSPNFQQWQREVEPRHLHKYAGMEGIFVSAEAPNAPPRWKMAVILLIAVFPMSVAMSHWFAPILARLPLLTGAAITSMVMVVLMTYVLVPLLTKVFQRWLGS